MTLAYEWLLCVNLILGIVQLTFGSSTYDPYRFILSRGKPATQSSTDGSHVASYVTDGDFNNYDLPINYSKTTLSDNPYLQVDLGDNVFVSVIILVFPTDVNVTRVYKKIRLTLGPDAAVGSSANAILKSSVDVLGWYRTSPRRYGRYVTIQRMETSTELSLCEVAVYDMPLENLAYRRSTAATREIIYRAPYRAVDMDSGSRYGSIKTKDPWIRVDLSAVYFVHEVLIVAFPTCCAKKHLFNVDIRIGNSLSNNGNSNPFCTTFSMFTTEIRSFYCDMFGRFVNLLRHTALGNMEVDEIIINPESTANVLRRGATAVTNTPRYARRMEPRAIDRSLQSYFQTLSVVQEKRVWFVLKSDYAIEMIYIVADSLVDFEIRIGSSGNFNEGVQCLPGLQTMRGRRMGAFFCQQRITGNHVFVHQYKMDKTMMIREIAVYEETKPMFVDQVTDRYVWAETNKDATITCPMEGFPVPVATWVQDKTVVEKGSKTLQFRGAGHNESVVYECWANNTHGVDIRQFEVRLTSNLRICVDHHEMYYAIATSKLVDIAIKGTQWYNIYDPQGKHYLQFRQSLPPKHVSSCEVWLNGDHPKVQEGVVSRTLCVKSEANDCSSTINVYIRRCAAHFIYNFHNLRSTTGLKLCVENTPNTERTGLHPAVASPVKNHALSQKVFQTEPEVSESHQCLIMCQLDVRCKSFNHSKKLKICELNSATKSEFPGNYAFQADYDYHHMRHGAVMSVNREL